VKFLIVYTGKPFNKSNETPPRCRLDLDACRFLECRRRFAGECLRRLLDKLLRDGERRRLLDTLLRDGERRRLLDTLLRDGERRRLLDTLLRDGERLRDGDRRDGERRRLTLLLRLLRAKMPPTIFYVYKIFTSIISITLNVSSLINFGKKSILS
jgi:hypothetical protein